MLGLRGRFAAQVCKAISEGSSIAYHRTASEYTSLGGGLTSLFSTEVTGTSLLRHIELLGARQTSSWTTLPSIRDFSRQYPTDSHHRNLHVSSPSKPDGSESSAEEKKVSAKSYEERFVTLPNAVSMARLFSGPWIASLIMEGRWGLASGALVVAGASDWLDGYLAKGYGKASVFGSYLDPLADKVLICSVVGALAYEGILSGPVVAVIVGRDVFLVGAIFAHRAHTLGWRWPGYREFFRVSPAGTSSPSPDRPAPVGNAPGLGESAESGEATKVVQPAPFVQPIFISKLNTVLQMSLVGGHMAQEVWGGIPEVALTGLAAVTVGTTVASCAAYIRAFLNGRILTPPSR